MAGRVLAVLLMMTGLWAGATRADPSTDAGARSNESGDAFAGACARGVKTACFVARSKASGSTTAELESARALAVTECGAGSDVACGVLARFWQRGLGGPKNETKARDVFTKSCTMGFPLACNDLALMWITGAGGEKDATKARPLFEKACLGDFIEACDNLGVAWFAGDGGPSDASKTRVWLEKGCTGGFTKSCLTLSGLHLKGLGGPLNVVAAAAVMKNVCALPVDEACRSMPADPEGCRAMVTRECEVLADDPPEKKQKDCDAQKWEACFSLGTGYLSGVTVKQDDARALGLFQKACEGGHADACSATAGMYTAQRGFDPAQAKMMADGLLQQCDGGHGTACYFLSSFYLTGHGVKKDKKHAIELLQRALAKGCVAAASFLGESYARGDGVPANDAKAFEVLTRGCEGGESHSCFSLGLMYEMGRTVKADPKKAKALYQKACRNGLGYAKACQT